MRFKVDENLPEDAVALLCAAGHAAISAHGQRMSGAEDRTLFEVCRSEHRVMLTLDLDFADILTYPPEDSPGIVVLRLARQDKRHVLDVLRRLLPRFERDPVAGHLWIVDEQRIRMRGAA